MPAEDQPNQEEKGQQEEKSPENMCDFFVLVNKVGQKGGLLIEAVTVDTQVYKFVNIIDPY